MSYQSIFTCRFSFLLTCLAGSISSLLCFATDVKGISVVQTSSDPIAGSYSGTSAGSNSNCTDSDDNGSQSGRLTSVSIVVPSQGNVAGTILISIIDEGVTRNVPISFAGTVTPFSLQRTLRGTVSSSSAVGTFTGSWNVDAANGKALLTFNIVGIDSYVDESGKTQTCSVAISVSVSKPYAPPLITSVRQQYEGFFLEGADFDNRFDVAVDWKGQPPGTVSFAVNNAGARSEQGTATGASHVFAMKSRFQPSRAPSIVAIIATNAAGVKSEPVGREVYVFPYPTWLRTVLNSQEGSGINVSLGDGEVTSDLRFKFPQPPFGEDKDALYAPENIPFLGGRLGPTKTFAEVAAKISSKGTGSASLKGESGFTAGKRSITGKIFGSGDFVINPPNGLVFTKANVGGKLTGVFDTGEVRLTRAIPSVALLELTPLVGRIVEKLNKRATVKATLAPSIESTFNFAQNDAGNLASKNSSLTFGLKLDGVLKVYANENLNATAYASGSGSGVFDVTAVSELKAKEAKFSIEAGAAFNSNFLFKFNLMTKANYGCTYSPQTDWKCGVTEGASMEAPSSAANIFGAADVSLIEPSFDEFGRYADFRWNGRNGKTSNLTPHALRGAQELSPNGSFVNNIFAGETNAPPRT